MKINELILETEQLDELSAAGVGTGVGKVAGAAVKGVKDFWAGAKAGYQQGRWGAGGAPATGSPAPASSAAPTATAPGGTGSPAATPTPASSSGAAPAAASGSAPGGTGSPAGASGGAPATPGASGAAPATTEFPKKADGTPVRFNGDTGEKFATPADAQAWLDSKLKADPNYGKAAQPATTPGASGAAPAADSGAVPGDDEWGAALAASDAGRAASASGGAPATPGASGAAPAAASGGAPASGAAAPAPAAMKSAEIVKGLDDVWKKATADQGSETSSPQVQNQIRAMAKAAGLAGQTIKENKVGYRSKFLQMVI